jgi:hypothetical protein
MSTSSQGRQSRANTVQCVECGASSGLLWRGWCAYRTDDPEQGEPPALAFFCPSCARREFGKSRRKGDRW